MLELVFGNVTGCGICLFMDGIFGKVWKNVSLFLSLLMVLPFGFYIIRFLRRKILLNSFSGTSLIICSLMYLISLVVILDCWRFLFGLMMVGFCYLEWHGGPWLVPWISDDAEVYLGFQFEFDSFLSSCSLVICM